MEKFVPYLKLSKKKKRALNSQRRAGWGNLNPVTRKSANPKAYNRQKARKWEDDFTSVLLFFTVRLSKQLSRMLYRSAKAAVMPLACPQGFHRPLP